MTFWIKRCIIIIVISFFISTLVTPAFAQTTVDISNTSPTPIPYDLSYPGLLPGHPFYFLKQARDNMLTLLIGKPLDKASFLLLQADKQASAGQILMTQKKDMQLVNKSLFNAQKSFDEAIACTKDAKNQGLSTGDIIQKLQIASKKHHELVEDISRKANAAEKKSLEIINANADKLMVTTASLRP